MSVKSIIASGKLPGQVFIYYDKEIFLMRIIFGGVLLSVGLLLLFSAEALEWAFGFIVVSVGLVIHSHLKYANRRPQIVVDENGIAVGDGPSYKWTEINYFATTTVFPHKGVFLVYEHPNGQTRLDLSNLEVDIEDLEYLIQ